MATIESVYLGELRTSAKHLKSGIEIITDAPVDNQGKGEAFSPSDLVAGALGSCMMTIMGIVARRENIDITGIKMEITKIMTPVPPRKIAEIQIKFDIGNIQISDSHKEMLKHAAHTCPVALSIHPDIKQTVEFGF